MRILVAVVHYWNPQGGGRHQSLRPDPGPKLAALRELTLALSRLGGRQLHLNFSDQAAYAANLEYRHTIDIHLITDERNHLWEFLGDTYTRRLTHVVTHPHSSMSLGFEAQRHLAEHLDSQYDLYAYFEDDLIIHDPLFFLKIKRFCDLFGNLSVLLPHRFEFMPFPAFVDKLYIDGVLSSEYPAGFTANYPLSVESDDSLAGITRFQTPCNPHAGCFVLTHQQLCHWVAQPWWLDHDSSFVSPLESAATLGILKTFNLYKPVFAQACWLEIQHSGTGYMGLMSSATPDPPKADE